jgi:hypothetical protein
VQVFTARYCFGCSKRYGQNKTAYHPYLLQMIQRNSSEGTVSRKYKTTTGTLERCRDFFPGRIDKEV